LAQAAKAELAKKRQIESDDRSRSYEAEIELENYNRELETYVE
jgi:hypothetical protein